MFRSSCLSKVMMSLSPFSCLNTQIPGAFHCTKKKKNWVISFTREMERCCTDMEEYESGDSKKIKGDTLGASSVVDIQCRTLQITPGRWVKTCCLYGNCVNIQCWKGVLETCARYITGILPNGTKWTTCIKIYLSKSTKYFFSGH